MHKLNSDEALLVLACHGGGRDEMSQGSRKPVRDSGPEGPPKYRVPKGPKNLPLSLTSSKCHHLQTPAT